MEEEVKTAPQTKEEQDRVQEELRQLQTPPKANESKFKNSIGNSSFDEVERQETFDSATKRDIGREILKTQKQLETIKLTIEKIQSGKNKFLQSDEKRSK